jgi:phosphatidylinositol alpha-1,6-mannosyltransferase
MIIGLFPELSTAGGIQRSSCLVALALASFAKSHSEPCRFISLSDPVGAATVSAGGQEIHFVGCGLSKLRFLSNCLALAIRQPIIVVALHPNLAPIVSVMKILAPGMRSAVVVHGVEVWTPLSMVRRLALRSADRVLAPSEDTLSRAIKQQRLTTTKVRKLAWSLGPEFDPHKDLCVAASQPTRFPRGRVILTVGRWDAKEAYKGVDHLIAALPALVKSFPDVHLVAVGEGTDVPRLQSLAQESGCLDHIHFLPFIPHDQLRNVYDSCEVFAMPSSGEGFGLVFIEAMARGKPVIGGAHGGTPDVIDDGINGFLVPYGDVTQLADRLARLLANDSLRREMGAQALAKARRHFTFARFSSELAAILTELTD